MPIRFHGLHRSLTCITALRLRRLIKLVVAIAVCLLCPGLSFAETLAQHPCYLEIQSDIKLLEKSCGKGCVHSEAYYDDNQILQLFGGGAKQNASRRYGFDEAEVVISGCSRAANNKIVRFKNIREKWNKSAATGNAQVDQTLARLLESDVYYLAMPSKSWAPRFDHFAPALAENNPLFIRIEVASVLRKPIVPDPSVTELLQKRRESAKHAPRCRLNEVSDLEKCVDKQVTVQARVPAVESAHKMAVSLAEAHEFFLDVPIQQATIQLGVYAEMDNIPDEVWDCGGILEITGIVERQAELKIWAQKMRCIAEVK